MNKKFILIILIGMLFICGCSNKIMNQNGGNNSVNNNVNNKEDIVYSYFDNDNYIAVKNSDGKYGYIDKDGNVTIDFVYSKAYDFINGVALVTNDNYEFGLIDSNNKLIVNFGKYKEIYRVNENAIITNGNYNLFVAKDLEGKVALLSSKGEVLTKSIYDEISVGLTQGEIVFKKNDLWGILNSDGKEIYTSNSEIKVSHRNDNLTLLTDETKNVLINNKTGKVITNLPLAYNEYIFKYNDYYVVQERVIYNEEIMFTLKEEDGDILNINDLGIVEYINMDQDIKTYFSLKENKQILSINTDNEVTVFLDKYLVYQDENGYIYLINEKGEKTQLQNMSNKVLNDGFGNNIVLTKREERFVKTENVTREETLYDIYNFVDSKYIKENLLGISIYPLEKSSDTLKDYYSIDELIETDVPNEYGAYYGDKFYIMDSNGNHVNDLEFKVPLSDSELTSINKLSGKNYFIGLDSNNKYGVVDVNNNVAIEFKYKDIKRQYEIENIYLPCISLIDENNNMDIYDLVNNKLILSISNVTESYPIIYKSNYMIILGNLYNYEGKLIYTNN